MKRALVCLIVALCVTSAAQNAGTQQYSTTILSNQPYTVATLPSSPPTGFLAIVTDGNGVSCTAGSSTTKVLCRYSGSAWQVVGGTGSSSITINTTTNTLPKKTGAAAFGDSLLSDDGTKVTDTGTLSLPAGTYLLPSLQFPTAAMGIFSVNATSLNFAMPGASTVGAARFDSAFPAFDVLGGYYINVWDSTTAKRLTFNHDGTNGNIATSSGGLVFNSGSAGANDFSGSTGTFLTSTGLNTLKGPVTLTPPVRTSGVASYLTLNIPADTGQTASTESIGFQTVTGTRTWATTGTVALQRENFFAGPTYASASASQTFTDPFTLYLTPPIQGTNAIFTRNHTLGIVDSTSTASSITGGLVVATTLGTAATSVGIGGGNVNAGGIVTGNTLVSGVSTGTAPLTVASTTQVTNLNASQLIGGTWAIPGTIGSTTPNTGAFSSLSFNGSAPAVTTTGTTPYLNMNTLVKGAINTCTFNFTTSQFTLAASPLSMCSPVYTLPNAALTWYYTCSFTWSVTAGTTPTLTFGQTFSQAPSAANEWQSIFTSNAGVSIQASQAVTSNSSMTATGSLTTSATLFQATIGGSFTASATSGTFSPTATLTGTSAVGTLRGGCVIQ